MRGFPIVAALPLFLALLPFAGAARAQGDSVALTLKDHKFTPAEVTIPANKRVKFVVKNEDATPAEFESDDFKAEKVLPAGASTTVLLPALKPGSYEFHDEYHESSSKSRVTAK